MNFEIVNKATEGMEVSANHYPALITVKDRRFYFTKEAVKQFKMLSDDLSEDRYLHLVRGKDQNNRYNGCWYFIVNNQVTGFKITRGSHGAAVICNNTAVLLFRKETKCLRGDSFYLQNTESELNGSTVVEILVRKSVAELKKGLGN
jgi:hypothetical protein